MASFWMLDSSRNPIGPFDDERIRQLADQGKLAPSDALRHVEGGEWVPALSIRPAYFRAVDPPPPPIQPPRPPMPSLAEANPGLGLLIPLGVDPLALIAGYAGLFALVVFPAPVALVLGIVALRRLRSRPGARGAGRAWFAVIAGAIGSTALIVGLTTAWRP